MVNLTRIYTRTGDDGTTALGDFSRTTKTDPRLVAYADVDEANSAIGVALALDAVVASGVTTSGDVSGAGSTADSSGGSTADSDAGTLGADVVAVLRRVQNDLFDVGADLCTPLTTAPREHQPLRITAEYVSALEQDCDRFNAELAPLRSFILPGGTPAAAQLHVARTVTRRAERSVWTALEHHGASGDGGVNPMTARYLNRLSDLLFILCRYANRETGDVLWAPGGPTSTSPAPTSPTPTSP